MAKSSAYFLVDNAGDKHTSKAIKENVGKLHGVISVSIADDGETVAVDYDTTGVTTDRIEKQFENLGLSSQLKTVDEHIM
ncbi:MAG: heavy metal-associated domain protein [Bacillota bacterium]|nr:heavy metal-associated domain protein [Bacillota bacterium]